MSGSFVVCYAMNATALATCKNETRKKTISETSNVDVHNPRLNNKTKAYTEKNVIRSIWIPTITSSYPEQNVDMAQKPGYGSHQKNPKVFFILFTQKQNMIYRYSNRKI